LIYFFFYARVKTTAKNAAAKAELHFIIILNEPSISFSRLCD